MISTGLRLSTREQVGRRRRASAAIATIVFVIAATIATGVGLKAEEKPAAAATAAPLLGELPWYKLDSFELSDRVSLGVNVGSGNMVLRSTEFAIRGTGLNLGLSRFYNSRSSAAGAFGGRWSLGLGQDVRLTPKPDGSAVYTGPSGYAATFTPNGSGGFTTPPTFSYADLKRQADGQYELTFRESGERLRFNPSGAMVANLDRHGNATTLAYNADGTLASITDTQGRKATIDYEMCKPGHGHGDKNHCHGGPGNHKMSSGRVSQITDPIGRRTLYRYHQGNLKDYVDATGARWKFSYSAQGDLAEIIDPRGRSTSFSYDGDRRVTSITRAAKGRTPARTSYSYQSGKTVMTDPNGHQTTFVIDPEGRTTSVTDALGRTRNTKYDPNFRVTELQEPSAAVTKLTWNLNGTLASIQAPSSGQGQPGVKVSFQYTDSAHPYLPTFRADPQGNRRAFSYNQVGDLISTTSTNAAGQVMNRVRRSYHGDRNPDGTSVNCGARPGQLCTETDARQNTTTFGYDGRGNVISVTYPPPLGAKRMTVDGVSRVTSVTDGNNHTTRYTWDGSDRLTEAVYADGARLAYRWDGNGNLISRMSAAGMTTWSFDDHNRVTEKTLVGRWARRWSHDLAGNMVSATDSSGEHVTYRYNQANELVSLSEPGGRTTNFRYNNNGQRTETRYPNGVTQTIGYDDAGRQISIRATNEVGVVYTNLDAAYTSSSGSDTGQIQTITDRLSGAKSIHSYDGLNQLTRARTVNASGATTSDYQFVLDPAGNRTQQIINGGSGPAYGFNSANQLVTANGAPWGTYDGNGALTSDGTGKAFAYNAAGQTTSITPPGKPGLTMAYADADQTERVRVGDTTQVSGLFGVEEDHTPVGKTYYVKDNAGSLISQRTPSGTYYYLFDLLGSVVGLTDVSGKAVNRYSYSPFGELTSNPNAAPVPNPWRYAGGYYDTQTALTKFGARFYDPSVGRWTQQDPIPGSIADPSRMNRYPYVGNDPINNVDPEGLWFGEGIWKKVKRPLGKCAKWGVIGAGAGAAGGAAAGLLPAGLTGGLSVAGGAATGAVSGGVAGCITGAATEIFGD